MTAPGKIGFDDDGHPVGVTEFDFAAVDRDAAIEDLRAEFIREIQHDTERRLLALLLDGNASVKEVGFRAHVIAFGLGCHPAEKEIRTQMELAKYLKTSQSAVSRCIKKNRESSNKFKALRSSFL